METSSANGLRVDDGLCKSSKIRPARGRFQPVTEVQMLVQAGTDRGNDVGSAVGRSLDRPRTTLFRMSSPLWRRMNGVHAATIAFMVF